MNSTNQKQNKNSLLRELANLHQQLDEIPKRIEKIERMLKNLNEEVESGYLRKTDPVVSGGLDEENEYSVVWHGNEKKGEKRDYHRKDFKEEDDAIDYYETIAHGWVTGISSPYFRRGGQGNSRMLFKNKEVFQAGGSRSDFWSRVLPLFYQTEEKPPW
jgi:hypothetical protein